MGFERRKQDTLHQLDRSRHIKYFLYQQPISPWRVWHFRIPAWLQKTLSREEVGPVERGVGAVSFRESGEPTIPLPMPHVLLSAGQMGEGGCADRSQLADARAGDGVILPDAGCHPERLAKDLAWM